MKPQNFIRLATTYPELSVAFLFGGSGTGIVGPVIAREPGGFLDISTSALAPLLDIAPDTLLISAERFLSLFSFFLSLFSIYFLLFLNCASALFLAKRKTTLMDLFFSHFSFFAL